MTDAETPRPPEDDADTLAWMQGLAGHGEQSPHGQAGLRLREALLQETDLAPAPASLRDLQRLRARHLRTEQAAVLAAPGRERAAANHPWAWASLAATLLLAVGLGLHFLPTSETNEEPRERGPGTASQAPAQWRVAQPAAQAETLATELRRLGAEVQLGAGPACVQMQIQAPAAATAAVNARLRAFELGLDSNSRAVLNVCPPP